MAKKASNKKANDIEVCEGCEAEAPQHPWVGIMHHEDVQIEDSIVIDTGMNGVEFVGVAVCDACHRDPTHRQRTLKCHFQPRAMGRVGVLMAGSDNLGM